MIWRSSVCHRSILLTMFNSSHRRNISILRISIRGVLTNNVFSFRRFRIRHFRSRVMNCSQSCIERIFDVSSDILIDFSFNPPFCVTGSISLPSRNSLSSCLLLFSPPLWINYWIKWSRSSSFFSSNSIPRLMRVIYLKSHWGSVSVSLTHVRVPVFLGTATPGWRSFRGNTEAWLSYNFFVFYWFNFYLSCVNTLD